MTEQAKVKTVLVTGGAGFIGSHMCEKYLNEGCRVICIDNLQTTFSNENIEHLLGNKNFTFIKHDIINPIHFKEKIDWIFNMACPAQCVNLQWDPVHTLKTSVHGVINMLELAKEHGARILQASTSEIYGHEPKMPQVETDCGEVNTLGPRACYDEGKRVSETLMMDYYRKYGVDVRIIRIFNTYGPRMYVRDGRVMSNFIIPALEGKPLTIYGDGSYTRSFQYVDDLLNGADLMMRQEGFIGPVNLGNPHEISIKQLADLVIKETGGKSQIVYKELVTDDPVRRKPDTSLAKEKLGWESRVTLEEGMRKTIEYFKTARYPDKKILMFATTYYPDMGPAENAVMELTKSMPDTKFYIVTAKSNRKQPDFEQLDNNYIYRVGSGNVLGKFLFPFRGAKKAQELSREHRFRFVWSIMASYGGLAAVIMKFLDKNINFVLTYDKSEEENRGFLKKILLKPLYGLIFKQADSYFFSDEPVDSGVREIIDSKEVPTIKSDDGMVEQVQATYAQLLNKQEKKLDRPM